MPANTVLQFQRLISEGTKSIPMKTENYNSHAQNFNPSHVYIMLGIAVVCLAFSVVCIILALVAMFFKKD